MQNFQSRPQFQNYAYNSGQPSQPTQPPYQNQPSYRPPQQTNLADDRFNQLQQLIMAQQQSIARLEAQIGQIAESTIVGKPGSRAEAWWWNFKNFHKINHINHIHVRSYLI